MRLSDFELMIRRLSQEVPASFFEGVAEVTVSPRAMPHPTRAEIYTLGECIPLPASEGAGLHGVQSRIVLYHGSFAALARLHAGFDWRAEAWETLTHELRHHLEWRARAPDLEALDVAVEHNFARQDGERFDPGFYLDGETLADGVYRVDDDIFLERVVRQVPASVSFQWHGRSFRVEVPSQATLPAFLTIADIEEPPAGDLVLVLRRRPGLGDLWRGLQTFQATVMPVEERQA